jgi:hypothetical protein
MGLNDIGWVFSGLGYWINPETKLPLVSGLKFLAVNGMCLQEQKLPGI